MLNGATMTSFRIVGRSALRTPSLPTSVLQNIYDSGNVKKALYETLQSRPDIVALLRVTSESLHLGIRRWLSHNVEDDRGAALGALGYIARSSTRPTPFGACATVGLVENKGNASVPFTIASAPQRRTRPDYSWMNEIARRLESDDETFRQLRLRPSGLTYLKHGRIEVVDISRTLIQVLGSVTTTTAAPTSLNRTQAVEIAAELCVADSTAGEVAHAIAARLSASEAHALAFLRKLVNLGIVLTELRLPLTADPVESMRRILRRTAPTVSTKFERIIGNFARADSSSLADAAEILHETRVLAEVMATAEHYWQIDSSRAYTGSVSPDVVQQVEAVTAKLAEISVPLSENSILARAFLAKYNFGREVPLLEILDLSTGLLFEDAFAEAGRGVEVRDIRLLELAAATIADGSTTLHLDEEMLRILKTNRADQRIARDYESICLVASLDSPRLLMMTNAHEGRYNALARFQDILDFQEPPAPDTEDSVLDAELVIIPHYKRAANVAIRGHAHAYEVACGVWPAVENGKTLTLDDLVVGVYDGRMYLRSLKNDKVVRVHQNHLLNVSTAARVARFFAAVASGDLPVVSFNWGRLASGLPAVPEVRIDGVIVSPRRWRVPKSIAADMASSEAAAWRARWKMPHRVYIVEYDNRLMVDLRHALCRQFVSREAQKLNRDDTMLVEDAVPAFGDEGCRDEAGRGYFAELTVHMRAEGDVRSPIVVPESDAPFDRKRVLRPLGSDWCYAKFYVGRERMNYFIENDVCKMIGSLQKLFSEVHFIQYADPDHHVRVRFKAVSGGEDRLLAHFVATVRDLIDAGTVDRAVFDVYDREVERYGGYDVIEMVEAIFTADSLEAAIRLKGLRTGLERTQAYLNDLAEFTLALIGNFQDTKTFVAFAVGRRPKISQDEWQAIRACPVAKLHVSGYGGVRRSATNLVGKVNGDRKLHVLRAIVHMHCNRIGLSNAEESRVLILLLAVLERHSARTIARPTPIVAGESSDFFAHGSASGSTLVDTPNDVLKG